MFDEQDLTTTFFRNPMMIQRKVLQEHQDRLNGEYAVADPNNSFMYLLEATSNMTAESMRIFEKALSEIYPSRSIDMQDLYKHIPDFVSVNINNTPATLPEFSIVFDKEYLIANATKYDENYNKIIIPKDTIISIGKYKFSLYYPIDMIINRRTNSITVVHDTTTLNPLKTLNYNVVDTRQYTFQSLQVLDITFPIFQFVKTNYYEEVIISQGFNKEYDYVDKFYAIRVYDKKKNKELKITYSNNIYDYYNPTAVVTLKADKQKIIVQIPQMYLSQNMVSDSLEIEIYTTKGKLNVDISEIDESDININFSLDKRTTTTHSAILNTIPTMILRPISDRIEGGSDSLEFEELRDRVVNDTLYDSIPISQLALEKYFEKEGYSVKKLKDNITDRVLLGYKPLTNGTNKTIPSLATIIKLTDKDHEKVSSIIKQSDESLSILPTTIYEYNLDNDICKPISDAEKDLLFSLDKASFSKKLNDNNYTKSPFHITLFTRDRYPEMNCFDLNNPYLSNLSFIKDNITTSIQMVVAAFTITHLNEGSGGYLIRLGMSKSDEIKNILEDDILVYLTAKTYTGAVVGIKAIYQGELENLAIYDILIDTNYHIDDSNIEVRGFETKSNVSINQYLKLTTDFDILVAINKDAIVDNQFISNDNEITKNLSAIYSNYIGVTKQRITCTFGTDISDTLYTNVNINMSEVSYLKYTSDIPKRYERDKYEFNPDGTLKILDVVDGKLILNKEYSAGDIMYENGQPILVHRTGEVVHDDAGEPVIDQDSSCIYYLNSLHIDLKFFYTENPAFKDFNTQITKTIRTYLSQIADFQKNVLLERTSLYFEPTQTMGRSRFGLGDNKYVNMDLGLSFKLSFYVPEYVYIDNNILDMIRKVTINIINKNLNTTTISMTRISEEIKNTLGDYIYSMDIGGINNDIGLQTLLIEDKSTRPIIKNKLVYENNILDLIEDVDIKFIKAT
jgi:hypothetical protein